ncbi:hypothetical protein ADUPG1_007139 [Aduncisulcus paluster]|uniref:Cathepsin propeptide inhibitor domain-containing protein n=1 Tax=Aduncisulcus paluster TaxID=2918883 RepID=A0ABQ5KKV2_9EUKA|nr:hypothetical protein ADUPG1_007139 [Aduncisulcus paluster]
MASSSRGISGSAALLRSLMTHKAVCEIDASDVRFAAYSRRFAKKYASLEERTERQRLFSRRYAMIEKHNANTENTFTMVINKFADLTLDEIHKIYTGFRPAYRREGDEDHGNVNDDPFWHSGQFTHLIDHTPETVSDWRTIDWRLYSNTVSGTVNDQGNCGSCWAFSAVNALEVRLVIYIVLFLFLK